MAATPTTEATGMELSKDDYPSLADGVAASAGQKRGASKPAAPKTVRPIACPHKGSWLVASLLMTMVGRL